MKPYRLASTATWLLALASLCAAFREHYVEKEEDPKPKPGLFPSLLSHDHPRVISIFSKPSDPNAPKKVGPGIIGHIGNVLHGGTIGIQVQPLAGIQGVVGHAKKIITGGRDRVGNPHNEKPPAEGHWEEPSKDDHLERPPKGDHWGKPPRDDHYQRPPKDDHWGKPPRDDHYERPHKDDHYERPPKDDQWGKPPKDDHWEEEPEWEMKKPEKEPQPDKGGYSWDDIGEDQDRYSTEVPIEDIIMPRTRSRRFVESKIYHVPLMFRSNGKTYKIVGQRTRQNSLDGHKKP